MLRAQLCVAFIKQKNGFHTPDNGILNTSAYKYANLLIELCLCLSLIKQQCWQKDTALLYIYSKKMFFIPPHFVQWNPKHVCIQICKSIIWQKLG